MCGIASICGRPGQALVGRVFFRKGLLNGRFGADHLYRVVVWFRELLVYDCYGLRY